MSTRATDEGTVDEAHLLEEQLHRALGRRVGLGRLTVRFPEKPQQSQCATNMVIGPS